jgi:hypothetical protein
VIACMMNEGATRGVCDNEEDLMRLHTSYHCSIAALVDCLACVTSKGGDDHR